MAVSSAAVWGMKIVNVAQNFRVELFVGRRRYLTARGNQPKGKPFKLYVLTDSDLNPLAAGMALLLVAKEFLPPELRVKCLSMATLIASLLEEEELPF